MSEILPDEDDEQPNKRGDTAPDDDEIDKRNKLLIDIWKQAVDTQKHFNDMCVKSRQLGLTFVAASLVRGRTLPVYSIHAVGLRSGNGRLALDICLLILHLRSSDRSACFPRDHHRCGGRSLCRQTPRFGRLSPDASRSCHLRRGFRRKTHKAHCRASKGNSSQ